MKVKFLTLVILLTSSHAFSQSYYCDYTDMDDRSGVVTVNVDGDQLSARINRTTYSAKNCEVDRTLDSEVLVTCDENSGRGMGFMVEDMGDRREGYLIIEKLSFFAELNCK